MAGPAGEMCKASQLAAVLLLLSVVVHPTASVPNCSVKEGKWSKLKLKEMGYGYFRTNLEKVQIKMHTRYRHITECKLSNGWFNEAPRPVSPLLHINISDLTPTSVASLGDNKEPWYEVSFIICDKIPLVRIGSRVTELLQGGDDSCYPEFVELYIKGAKMLCPSKIKYTEVKSNCPEVSTLPLNTINSSSTPSPTENISDIFSSQNDQIMKLIESNYEDDSWKKYRDINPDIMNIHGSYDSPSLSTITLPTINRMEDRDIYEGIEYQSRGEENAIPIFIGVMAFTLSMCMRFCLCRGKSVVQRVTTVTVIRSRPAPEAQEENQHDPALDPPPAYVDVVNETSTPQESTQEPPPPAYSDIDPPPYFELAVPEDKLPESTAGPERQDSSGQSFTDAPSDNEVPQELSGAVTSAFGRALSKARAQQKQFSFKPLEEDD